MHKKNGDKTFRDSTFSGFLEKRRDVAERTYPLLCSYDMEGMRQFIEAKFRRRTEQRACLREVRRQYMKALELL